VAWDQRYIDAPVARFDASGDAVYYTNDANFNVTALVDEAGNVVERYAYSPYGERTVLDADFSADADGLSDVDNTILYAGYHYDPETTLYHVRNRMYNAELGRFITRDPLGYVDGMSVYEYVGGNSLLHADPYGSEKLDLVLPGGTKIEVEYEYDVQCDQSTGLIEAGPIVIKKWAYYAAAGRRDRADMPGWMNLPLNTETSVVVSNEKKYLRRRADGGLDMLVMADMEWRVKTVLQAGVPLTPLNVGGPIREDVAVSRPVSKVFECPYCPPKLSEEPTGPARPAEEGPYDEEPVIAPLSEYRNV
jgi:RHS repeat-associated protein